MKESPREESVLNYDEANEVNLRFHVATILITRNFAPKILKNPRNLSR